MGMHAEEGDLYHASKTGSHRRRVQDCRGKNAILL